MTTDGSTCDTHQGSPVSALKTKRALLVANHKDTLVIEGHGEMKVAKRTDPYYGPCITLWDGESNYRLHGCGFAYDPLLWEAISDEEGFIQEWERVGHVSVELTEVGKAEQCECGELLKTRKDKRMALVGVCPHD